MDSASLPPQDDCRPRLSPGSARGPRLQRVFSLAGDVVLDSFAGEGTTRREALALGRSTILNEREFPYAAMIPRVLGLQPLPRA